MLGFNQIFAKHNRVCRLMERLAGLAQTIPTPMTL